MKPILAITAALTCLLVSPPLSSADSLGNKYSCTGTALKSRGQSITLKNAKGAIKDVLKSTRAQLKNAEVGSSKANKLSAKIASLQATLTLVKSCAAGTYVPQIFSTISGAYATGVWHNTTFNSSGGLSANISVSGTVLSVSINIGGSMFGGLSPGPVEFQKDVGGAKFPFRFTAEGTTIGDLDITISKSGGLQITESSVPSPARADLLRATLTATFENGGYTGTFESFVLGNIQLAEGTMSLAP